MAHAKQLINMSYSHCYSTFHSQILSSPKPLLRSHNYICDCLTTFWYVEAEKRLRTATQALKLFVFPLLKSFSGVFLASWNSGVHFVGVFQLVNWLETPPLRCIAKCSCLVVAVWSWTAGKDGPQKRSQSSPMGLP